MELPQDQQVRRSFHSLLQSRGRRPEPLPGPARRLDLFAENVRRYVNGLPLLNVVDQQRGY